MKNVLVEQKKIKLWNKWHSVENKTDILQHVLKMQYISLLPKHIKLISRGVFLHAFVYVNAGRSKINMLMPEVHLSNMVFKKSSHHTLHSTCCLHYKDQPAYAKCKFPTFTLSKFLQVRKTRLLRSSNTKQQPMLRVAITSYITIWITMDTYVS
jgi:hypothetical protein